MKAALPPTYDSIVALHVALRIESAAGTGQAIALSFDGKEMLYLVVLEAAGAPRWLREGEVLSATVAPPH